MAEAAPLPAAAQLSGENLALSDKPLSEVLAFLDSRPEGLSSEEVGVRTLRYGQNRIAQRNRLSLLTAYLLRLRSPLVLVLMAAALVSAMTGDVLSLAIILVILGLSITLDVLQEHRALLAAQSLKEQVSLTARVLRDAKWAEQPAYLLVPGDVIEISAGDLIPADCRLLQSRDLYVNEALLTGEAYPAEKQTDPDPGRGLLPRNSIFMGSSVLSGSGLALVVATGRNAQLGAIAAALRKSAPDTSFDIGIRDFGRMLLRATLLLVLGALLINLAFHRPPLQSLLFSLALAVGLTPELLPMIISVTLAHGAVRLSKKSVIVKRLSAIHDLGAMDVLCSDKTGTLTEAQITLDRSVDWRGNPAPWALDAAVLNAHFETGLKSPIDAAILTGSTAAIEQWRKIDETPFDFERRRISVLVENHKERRLIVKGAPDDVLALCELLLVGVGTDRSERRCHGTGARHRPIAGAGRISCAGDRSTPCRSGVSQRHTRPRQAYLPGHSRLHRPAKGGRGPSHRGTQRSGREREDCHRRRRAGDAPPLRLAGTTGFGLPDGTGIGEPVR